jgi:electron transfer flavoprotein beta subunit
MKVAVLMKQVPDTETKIAIKGDASGIEEAGVKYVMNPYDEFAVEEAIKIGGESTVITMGPERTVEGLRTALAMGVQQAIHIDTQGKWYDPYTTATVLAKVLKDGGYQIILCGEQAIDGDNGQVVQMVAEFLGAPQVMIVDKIEMAGDKAKITRRVGGGTKEIYETGFPVVIGADKGLNTPRYASLPGIMKAKSKPVDKKNAEELLAGATPLIQFANYALPPERKAGKKIEGDPAQQAKELVRLLHEEAKVI